MSSEPIAFQVLTKPAGAICNLDCQYCFYLSKQRLYPGGRFRMSDDVLEAYIRQMLESQSGPEVNIAWQGGEPTLMGLDFFRRSVEIAEKHRRPGQRVVHSIQTNGLLLDDEWGAFFRERGFLVGLSVDGPRDLHDAYRVDKAGAGTFDRVMRGWEALRRHRVAFNILCAVHAANVEHPLEVYRFFRDDLGAEFVQFIPVVERAAAEGGEGDGNHGKHENYGNNGLNSQEDSHDSHSSHDSHHSHLCANRAPLVTSRSVGAEPFGRFLMAVFDEWVRRDVGKVFVQTFDVALGNWMGLHSLCIFSPTCGRAAALEHNGDLYSCDHYVDTEHRLGSILETPIAEMVASKRQRRFGQDKLDSLPRYCRECDVLFACFGECPRNRFVETPDGEPGLNYLCAGYKKFFHHIDGPMRIMARLLREGRSAAEIMESGPTAPESGGT